jgi:hypothetical protein
MDFKQYQALALRTESQVDTLNFGEVGLHMALNLMMGAASVADQMKRVIYYGKPLDREAFRTALGRVMGMAEVMGAHLDIVSKPGDSAFFDAIMNDTGKAVHLHPEKLNLRALHAGLGIFSEAGEALEILFKQLEGGEFDAVNWGEEVGGDLSWYQAIGHAAVGTDETVERIKNSQKLAKRYPSGFTSVDALNRDLAAERAILEGEA